MKQFYFLLLFFIFFSSTVFSQTFLRGKLTDEFGEPIIGATVSLGNYAGGAGYSDFNGSFSVKAKDNNPIIVSVSFIGYQTISDTITDSNTKVIVKNYVMSEAVTAIEEAVIVAKAVKSKDIYMQMVKSKKAQSIDYISAETIKKTGDSRVDEAIKRVPGVSTVGSFITVRGMGDRYIKTSVNDMRIPTLDPFTNNIKLDIFPTSLIDNIVIAKTASPDLPADWAGAYIMVETKDYPEQLTISATSTFGYNNQTTFNNVISSERSPTDWLGYDNGYRNTYHYKDIPDALNNYKYYNDGASDFEYRAYKALLSEQQFNNLINMGLNINNSSKYLKLVYIDLGLLHPAELNDQVALNNATTRFNNEYKPAALQAINANANKNRERFNDNWKLKKRTAPVNFSQEFVLGNQTTLLGKPLGFIVGLRYSTSVHSDPVGSKTNLSGALSAGDIPEIIAYKNNQTTQETNGWNGLVNVAYKINNNHSMALIFMPNFIGINKNVYDTIFYLNGDNANERGYSIQQNYEERKQLVYQFKSAHYLPAVKLKTELSASYTLGVMGAPDRKAVDQKFSMNINGKDTSYSKYLVGGETDNRSFEYLTDNIFDSKLSFEFPIWQLHGKPRTLKFGAGRQQSDRKDDRYAYGGADVGFDFLNDQELNANQYDSKWKNNSAYGMTDYTVFKWLRVSGGLRVEENLITGDMRGFDTIPAYSGKRPHHTEFSKPLLASPLESYNLFFLPSVSIILQLNKNESIPLNFRTNYSKTISYPGMRERMPFYSYDFELEGYTLGDPSLKNVQIYNYDFRLEKFFASGEFVSLSAFYKSIFNGIYVAGQVSGTTKYIRWYNYDTRIGVLGLEFEGKKNLVRGIDIILNYTLVDSRNTQTDAFFKSEHYKTISLFKSNELFGQASYVFNGILSYTSKKFGLSASAAYNIQGKRIAYFSDTYTKVYEMPRHLVDLKISKTVGHYFSTSLKIRNLLDQPIRNTYNTLDFKHDYKRINFGREFSLGISYNL